MSKSFEPRISKKSIKKIDLTDKLDRDLFKINDEKLLRGAELSKVALADIEVRKQVRTKFNDDSLRELAENIRENGLIQPLVIHREESKFVLICGERRFRAMTLIDLKEAPCFILENKTKEELMAIQFSENSSREDLHYIDQADSIAGYKNVTGASERKIQAALGISKSEVHRCLMISRLPKDVKEAAKAHNTEKYVLLEWDALEESDAKTELKNRVLSGRITKRLQLKRAITATGAQVKQKKTRAKAGTRRKTASANVFIKAIKERSKNMDLDRDTKKLLNELIKESKEMVDL